MVVKKDETQDDLITTNQNDLNDAEAENINGTEWVGYTIEVNLFISAEPSGINEDQDSQSSQLRISETPAPPSNIQSPFNSQQNSSQIEIIENNRDPTGMHFLEDSDPHHVGKDLQGLIPICDPQLVNVLNKLNYRETAMNQKLIDLSNQVGPPVPIANYF